VLLFGCFVAFLFVCFVVVLLCRWSNSVIKSADFFIQIVCFVVLFCCAVFLLICCLFVLLTLVKSLFRT
jgi:hypothetical protein